MCVCLCVSVLHVLNFLMKAVQENDPHRPELMSDVYAACTLSICVIVPLFMLSLALQLYALLTSQF